MTNAAYSPQARHSLAANTFWNIAGTFVPLIVGLLAIPPLLGALGIERLGLLSLVWMLTGYFGLLDLGLARALTKLVAEHAGTAESTRLPVHVWTGLWVMSAFGAAGALVLALAAEWLVRRALNIPEALQPEAIGAIGFLALSIPVAIASTGLRGLMDGLHLFRLANLIRIPFAALTFLAPLAVTVFTSDLAVVSASLLGVRILGLAAHWIACARAMPALAGPKRPEPASAWLLLRFGGWLTVTNVVGPLMTYLDRFVIGAVADLASVAHYATPYDVVTKLLLVPSALAGVLFPLFSGALPQGKAEPAKLMAGSLAAVFAVMFPVVALTVAFAQEGLAFWLGEDFASHSFRVLQWLAAGVLFNSLAQVPFAFVQGAGRPEWIARLHLAELPLYILVLWWMLGAVGIAGAAIAWTLRVTIDALALVRMAHIAAPAGAIVSRRLAFAVLAGIAALPFAALLEGALARAIVVALSAGVLPALAWGPFHERARLGA